MRLRLITLLAAAAALALAASSERAHAQSSECAERLGAIHKNATKLKPSDVIQMDGQITVVLPTDRTADPVCKRIDDQNRKYHDEVATNVSLSAGLRQVEHDRDIWKARAVREESWWKTNYKVGWFGWIFPIGYLVLRFRPRRRKSRYGSARFF